MFEDLSEKLNGVFERLGSKGRLTERDIDSALREVRMALLEADVNFRVARELIASIKEKVMADETMRTSLTPGQIVVKTANEELTAILTGGDHRFRAPSSSGGPAVAVVAGLNGAGKTTFAAKLARHLYAQSGATSTLVAADLQRPAAIDQLETLARQIDARVYAKRGTRDTVKIAAEGVRAAARNNSQWAIVDTAGRFQIDDGLMDEIEAVHKAVRPSETILVLDAMTGQEAVSVAQEFHRRIALTGLALTKMDGDARGGAALSITKVTGVPIKFLGTGERVDALEQFHPDRLASRILGMGDILSLIEKTEVESDESRMLDLDRKLRQSRFDMNDFYDQIQQLKSMGPLGQVVDMIPGFATIKNRLNSGQVDSAAGMRRVEAIINSMTPEERRRPEIIGGSRRRRIAKGSGTSPQEVNRLLNHFRQTQRMVKQMSTGRGRQNLMRMFGG